MSKIISDYDKSALAQEIKRRRAWENDHPNASRHLPAASHTRTILTILLALAILVASIYAAFLPITRSVARDNCFHYGIDSQYASCYTEAVPATRPLWAWIASGDW